MNVPLAPWALAVICESIIALSQPGIPNTAGQQLRRIDVRRP